MRKQRPILTLLALVLLAAACSQPKDRVRIEGRIAGVKQAEFYVYSDDGTLPGIDTVRIEDGRFAYERRMAEPAVLTLLYPNFSRTYVVAEPGKAIRMEGDAAKLGEADVTGSEENELLTDFRLKSAHLAAGDAQMAAADFIRSHPKTLAATAVFRKHFVHVRQPDAATALPLLDLLVREQPRNVSVAALARQLRPQLRNGVGQRLPDFEAKTLDGRTLTKADFAGKPMLVAFLASWNNESNPLLGKLKRIRRAHAGRLGLLCVSLDTDPAASRRKAKLDTLEAATVCDGKAFKSPLALGLGVRYVPGNLLIDAAGKIVARDVPADELEQRVGKLVK